MEAAKTNSIVVLAVFGVWVVAMFATDGFPSHHATIINQTTTIVKEVDSRVIPDYAPALNNLNDRLSTLETTRPVIDDRKLGISNVGNCYAVNGTPDRFICYVK